MAITLKDEKIIKDWGTVLEGCKGKQKEFYKLVIENVLAIQAPSVKAEEVKVATGWLSEQRVYVRVLSERMKDFRLYIGAEDYGKYLNVFCCLTCEPGYFKKNLSSLLTKGDSKALSFFLNIFERQDLIAWKTVMEIAIERSFDQLMESTGQKSSLLVPKGFLGIS